MGKRAPSSLSLALGTLALGTVVLTGEDPLPQPLFRSDAHLLYKPLESPEAERLLERALEFGRKKLGEAAIPLRRVQLRRSIPLDGGAKLRRGFQLTEIADSREGVFTIYLSALPGEAAFAGQLAHEAFHLFNARLRDAYVEGLNSLLAEDLLRELGLPWDHWLGHFSSGKEPLYGETYFLARELVEAVGRERLFGLLRFAVESKGDPRRMEIDIDRWLASLDDVARRKAEALIRARAASIEAACREAQPELAFRRPRRV